MAARACARADHRQRRRAARLSLCATPSADVRRADHEIIMDDLVEYAAIEYTGIASVSEVFHQPARGKQCAAHHRYCREARMERQMPEVMKLYPWPALPPAELIKRGNTHLTEIALAERPHRLSLGAIRLKDGNTLWFGRSSVEAERSSRTSSIISGSRASQQHRGPAAGALVLTRRAQSDQGFHRQRQEPSSA